MTEKSVAWFKDAKARVDGFPDEIGHEVCRVITALQRGDRHLQLKSLKRAGKGQGLDVVTYFDGKANRSIFFASGKTGVRVVHACEIRGKRKSVPSKAEMAIAATRTDGRPRTGELVRSAGNAFADMGIDFPDEFKGEAIIADEIYRIIRRRKMTKRAAMKAMDCKPEFIDAILNGSFTGYALRWPAVYLSRLGFDLEIEFKPTPGQRVGSIHVHTA